MTEKQLCSRCHEDILDIAAGITKSAYNIDTGQTLQLTLCGKSVKVHVSQIVITYPSASLDEYTIHLKETR